MNDKLTGSVYYVWAIDSGATHEQALKFAERMHNQQTTKKKPTTAKGGGKK